MKSPASVTSLQLLGTILTSVPVRIAATPDLDLSVMNFNKVVLLYGPPGTGKSSLWYVLCMPSIKHYQVLIAPTLVVL